MSLLSRVFFPENDNYLYLVNTRQWHSLSHPSKHPAEPALLGLATRPHLSKGGGVVSVQHVEVVLGGDGQGQVLERLLGGRNLKQCQQINNDPTLSKPFEQWSKLSNLSF